MYSACLFAVLVKFNKRKLLWHMPHFANESKLTLTCVLITFSNFSFMTSCSDPVFFFFLFFLSLLFIWFCVFNSYEEELFIFLYVPIQILQWIFFFFLFFLNTVCVINRLLILLSWFVVNINWLYIVLLVVFSLTEHKCKYLLKNLSYG